MTTLVNSFFFFTHPATTAIYTLSLHDALPISSVADMTRRLCQVVDEVAVVFQCHPLAYRTLGGILGQLRDARADRSEEHTSELQSHVNLVCRLLLEKKKKKINNIVHRCMLLSSMLSLSHDHTRQFFFFFHPSCDHRDLHSFPTRRSSDLLRCGHDPASLPGSRRSGRGVPVPPAGLPHAGGHPGPVAGCAGRQIGRAHV